MYNFWDRIRTPIDEYTKNKKTLKDSSSTSYSPLSQPISIPISRPISNSVGDGQTQQGTPRSVVGVPPIPSIPIGIPILRQSQMVNAITPSSYSPLPNIVTNKIIVPPELSEMVANGTMSPFLGGGLSSSQLQQQQQQQQQAQNINISENSNPTTPNTAGTTNQMNESGTTTTTPININNSSYTPSPRINISNSSSFRQPVSFSQYIQQSLLHQSLLQHQQQQQQQALGSSYDANNNNSPNIKHVNFNNSVSILKASSPTINFAPSHSPLAKPYPIGAYNDGADQIHLSHPYIEDPDYSSDDDHSSLHPDEIRMQTIISRSPEPIQTAVTDEHGNVHIIDIGTNVTTKKKRKRLSGLYEHSEKLRNTLYQILSPQQKLPIHIVDATEMESTVIPFLMELGRALLMSGVPAHRLEYELTLISSTFGIDGHFFSTPTGIFFSFGSPHTILSPYTHFLRINSLDYNMNRLVLLEELADLVIFGKIDCAEGLIRLRNILKAPPLYNDWLTIASFIVSSFAISFFFKSGWIEVGACSILGLYVGLLYMATGKWPTIGRVLEALSAFGGAIIASFFNAYIYPVHVFTVTLAGIIALAPGLSLTLSVAEISTRNLISGNARLMGVFASLLQLTFGISLGTKVCATFLPMQKELTPDSFPSWTMFLAVPLAAISFAVQMKVHPRQIWVITLASALGILCGNWGNKFFGDDVGSFFGSFGICLLGNLYARIFNTTSAVPIMSGILLLVPGSMGIRGLFQASTGDVSGGLEFFSGMFMIAISLTIGLLIANLIIRPHKAL
ncbi:hypothetical protein DLAC_09094 [Tieghemostelium lacteum]|uniref:Threonine/serine exporter-like N-terminal domain-containing protein n=1 Tax=Tieghemostelium lacteum TaxID=361077 RepID=A0A151Z948_TIELA|nr:hypothetical protein DLAC_09094 [Tieghemostelium lacteum]|eukprot:KYQ90471.1 hypothetical protein DLAC_09094 [Tieghemostelium lacteum]